VSKKRAKSKPSTAPNPGLPIKKGRAGTVTHDYKRNGTTTLFAALNMLDGRVIGTCMSRHRHREFLRFLKLIDQRTHAELDLHLIIDNYSTHKTSAVKRWIKSHPTLPFALHADLGFLAEHGRALLRRDHPKPHPPRRFQERRRAQGYNHAILENHNADPKPFIWTKSADGFVAVVAIENVVVELGDAARVAAEGRPSGRAQAYRAERSKARLVSKTEPVFVG
jgi:transposase